MYLQKQGLTLYGHHTQAELHIEHGICSIEQLLEHEICNEKQTQLQIHISADD